MTGLFGPLILSTLKKQIQETESVKDKWERRCYELVTELENLRAYSTQTIKDNNNLKRENREMRDRIRVQHVTIEQLKFDIEVLEDQKAQSRMSDADLADQRNEEILDSWNFHDCPDGLTPDGPICPKCGGRRGPSGIDGGTWVHF